MQLFSIGFFIAILTFLLIIAFRKKRNILFISILILYLISALASIEVYLNNIVHYNNVNLYSYLYFIILFLITLIPIKKYNDHSFLEINQISEDSANCFSWFLIILYVPHLLATIPSIIFDFNELLQDVNYVAEVYDENALIGAEQTGSSFQNPISVFRAIFAEIIIFWFFYRLTSKHKKIQKIFLFLAMLCPFVSSFIAASRTSMTWWALQIFFSYSIFRKFYSEKLKKQVVTYMGMIGGVFLFVFIILTIGRFSVDGDHDLAKTSFLSYLGQSTINFSQDVLDNDVYQMGDATVPLFRKFFGLDSSGNLFERQIYWSTRMNITQGAFYTYLGDIIFDWGPVLSMILIIILSFVFNICINTRGAIATKVNLEKLFILFLLANCIGNGLFYLSYKTIGGNLKLIISLLFVIFLVLSRKLKIK